MENNLTRRTLIVSCGVSGTTVIAGCFGSEDDGGTDDSDESSENGDDGDASAESVPDGLDIKHRDIEFVVDEDDGAHGFLAVAGITATVDDNWDETSYTATISVDGEERERIQVTPDEAQTAIEAGGDAAENTLDPESEGFEDGAELDSEEFVEDVFVAIGTANIPGDESVTVELADSNDSVSKTIEPVTEWTTPHRTAANSGLSHDASVDPRELEERDRFSYPEMYEDVETVAPVHCLYADETLYVSVYAYDDGSHLRPTVLAMDAETGDLEWETRPGADDGDHGGEPSHLVYHDGYVYLGRGGVNNPAAVYALDATDGSIEWEYELETTWSRLWLTADEEGLFVASRSESDTGLLELDLTDGSVTRERESGGPVTIKDDRYYFTEDPNHLVVTDRSFEETYWSYTPPQDRQLFPDELVVTDEYVFAQLRTTEAAYDTYLHVFDVEEGAELNDGGYLIAGQGLLDNPASASKPTLTERNDFTGEEVVLINSQTHGRLEVSVEESNDQDVGGWHPEYARPFVTGVQNYRVGPEPVTGQEVTDEVEGDAGADHFLSPSLADSDGLPFNVDLGSEVFEDTAVAYSSGTFYVAAEDELVVLGSSAVEPEHLLGYQSYQAEWLTAPGVPEYWQ